MGFSATFQYFTEKQILNSRETRSCRVLPGTLVFYQDQNLMFTKSPLT